MYKGKCEGCGYEGKAGECPQCGELIWPDWKKEEVVVE